MFNTISPAIDKYVQTEEFLGQNKDPVGDGALKGIEAAKSSLSLMPILRRPPPVARAISGGAAAFQPPPPGTGRAGMLQSIAQAMGPAMQSYYQEMDTRQALQMQMAAAQQKQENELAEQAYRQSHLGEQIRHNKATEADNALDRALKRTEGAPLYTKEGIDISNYPKIPKGQAMARLNKEKSGFATIIRDLGEMEKLDKELAEITKNNWIESGNPYIGGAMNAAKDVYGYLAPGKFAEEKRRETLLRKRLEAKTNEFRTTAEATLKGGGALAQGMYDRLTSLNLFPVANEPEDERRQKIRALKKEALPKYGALKDSVTYQRFIDPLEYENMHPELANESEDKIIQEESKASAIRKKFPNLANPELSDEMVIKWAASRGL